MNANQKHCINRQLSAFLDNQRIRQIFDSLLCEKFSLVDRFADNRKQMIDYQQDTTKQSSPTWGRGLKPDTDTRTAEHDVVPYMGTWIETWI